MFHRVQDGARSDGAGGDEEADGASAAAAVDDRDAGAAAGVDGRDAGAAAGVDGRDAGGAAGVDGRDAGTAGGTLGGDGRVRIVVSRTRAPRFVRNISDLIDAELVPLGSAGAKVAAVVCGEADAYVHAGGFYEWDTAAPVAVARAAGCHASRIDGSPLAYNQASLWMPDILVCRPALAGTLLQAIREIEEIQNAP
jgi:3'(2'), 5'-bisphosphate nucleotidase